MGLSLRRERPVEEQALSGQELRQLLQLQLAALCEGASEQVSYIDGLSSQYPEGQKPGKVMFQISKHLPDGRILLARAEGNTPDHSRHILEYDDAILITLDGENNPVKVEFKNRDGALQPVSLTKRGGDGAVLELQRRLQSFIRHNPHARSIEVR